MVRLGRDEVTARVDAVQVDLTECSDFRAQHSTVAASMAGAPLGTRCVLMLGPRTAPPPAGWLTSAIMRPGYHWQLAGDRVACEGWLSQYQREMASTRMRSDRSRRAKS